MRSQCNECGRDVIHVRDDYTGATFPVDAEPHTVEGFILQPPEEGKRNPRAIKGQLEAHVPHVQTCTGPQVEELVEEPDDG